MEYMTLLLVFLFSLFFSLALGWKEKGEKINVMQRLGRSAPLEEEIVNGKIAERKGSFRERVIIPLFKRIFELLAGLLPGGMTASTEIRLKQAGFNSEAAVGAFLAARLLSGIVLPLLICLILPVPFAGWIIIFMLGLSLPGLYLAACRRRRQEEIEKTLPDILDLLTVSVEAGLGFDGAILKVTEKSRGVLAEEFHRLIKENRMGKNRRDSLRDLAARLGNEKVDSFTRAIIQAEQLGIGFANVLRLQAEQVRRQRKQRIEEAAMKAPVKMLIPLVLFIFPTIFIVLLGPAVLKIITIFQ
ncbi:MAG TPA: secretion system protein [Firmicutes bacterium]|nr:secretion system protein [Bacillota bacterium]